MQVFTGLMIPFLGTTFGAFLVFFLTKELNERLEQSMMGFAAGVMAAASVWSLLIPAMELEAHMGKLAFLPAAAGFVLGMLFLTGTDWLVRKIDALNSENGIEAGRKRTEANKFLKNKSVWNKFGRNKQVHQCGKSADSKNKLMVLAVTIHNIPEGLSVGAAFAGLLGAGSGITAVSAFALALGIGVQNIPEGFIVAMPFRNMGMSRKRSFLYGTLSGAVEPVAAVMMILLTAWLSPLLPWLLAFSAGAMFYVMIEELIPEAMKDRTYHSGTAGFCAGFLIMMILDVALG